VNSLSERVRSCVVDPFHRRFDFSFRTGLGAIKDSSRCNEALEFVGHRSCSLATGLKARVFWFLIVLSW
jgi:hypothetical protein